MWVGARAASAEKSEERVCYANTNSGREVFGACVLFKSKFAFAEHTRSIDSVRRLSPPREHLGECLVFCPCFYFDQASEQTLYSASRITAWRLGPALHVSVC